MVASGYGPRLTIGSGSHDVEGCDVESAEVRSAVRPLWNHAHSLRPGPFNMSFTFRTMPRKDSWARLTHPIASPWPLFEEGDQVSVELRQPLYSGGELRLTCCLTVESIVEGPGGAVVSGPGYTITRPTC